MTSPRRHRTAGATRLPGLVLLVGIVVLVLVAAGCGGSSDDGVAALDTTSSSAAADTTTTDDARSDDPQQAALDWAACMRKNGVDVPDPQVDEDGRIQIRPGAGGRPDDIDNEAFQKASRACGSPFGRGGGPQLSDADREELQATMLKFAACMRQNGVDMPDPDFSGGGGMFRVGPGAGNGIDPGDPAFQKAQKACQSILQDGLPGGGPGLGSPTSGGAPT